MGKEAIMSEEAKYLLDMLSLEIKHYQHHTDSISVNHREMLIKCKTWIYKLSELDYEINGKGKSNE